MPMDLPKLQKDLATWQYDTFPVAAANDREDQIEDMRLGVIEEVGELAQVCLKHRQKIRGMEDPQVYRKSRDKEIGDVLVYYTQLCSAVSPEQSIRFTGGILILSGPPSFHLHNVTEFALGDFPVARFSRVVEHMAALTGIHAEDVLRIFFQRAQEVMGRETAKTRPLASQGA